jgi:hypothetical protein
MLLSMSANHLAAMLLFSLPNVFVSKQIILCIFEVMAGRNTSRRERALLGLCIGQTFHHWDRISKQLKRKKRFILAHGFRDFSSQSSTLFNLGRIPWWWEHVERRLLTP